MRYIYQSVAKDGNGKVIQAATASVFLAGGSTPADVYVSDVGGSSVNSVLTDSEDGSFSFWVDDTEYTSWNLFRVTVAKSGFRTKAYDDLIILPEIDAFYPDYSAPDQGLTGDYNTLKYYVDALGSDIGTIQVRHNSGLATTTYNLLTSETINAGTLLKIESGAIITVATGVTLTINGMFGANRTKAFNCVGTGSVVFGSVTDVFIDWWETNTTPGTTDMSTAFQLAGDSSVNANIIFSGTKYGIGSGVDLQRRNNLSGTGADTNSIGTELIALGAIDMVTYPNATQHTKVEHIRFDGAGVATSCLKYSNAVDTSGVNNKVDQVVIANCEDGLWLSRQYHSYYNIFFTGCSQYGVYLENDCQSNDFFIILQNCATYFYADDAVFNRIFIHASHDSGATSTLDTFIGLYSGSAYNKFTGYLEVGAANPSSGSMVYIDSSNSNSFTDMNFLNIGGFDEYSTFVIGDTGTTNVLRTIIRGCAFSTVDGAYYDIDIRYAAYTDISSSFGQPADQELVINEPDYFADNTRYVGAVKTDQITVSSAYDIKPSYSGKTINVDCTGGAVTVRLPRNTISNGANITIRKIDASANAVTIQIVGGVIYPGGGTSATLATAYEWVKYENQSSNWYLTGAD